MPDAALPTPEQEQRAEWELVLRDLEDRTGQMRQTRQDMTFKPWQAVLVGMTAGTALFAAGAAFVKLRGG